MADTESETLIKAINNDTRRAIIRLLMGKQMSYTELAHLLEFNLRRESGKFNFHLKQLADSGIVNNDNERDLYALTPKGEELYYLLLDIERDKQIDPHGMVTALIRLEGPPQFWFYASNLGMVAGLWSIMIGLLAVFALSSSGSTLVYGLLLLFAGFTIEAVSVRYYLRTSNELLGKRSTVSKVFSTLLLLSIQWYLIRTRNRSVYLLATFLNLFGWFLAILSTLLHVEEGVDEVGTVLYYLEGAAAVAVIIGLILLRRLYVAAMVSENR